MAQVDVWHPSLTMNVTTNTTNISKASFIITLMFLITFFSSIIYINYISSRFLLQLKSCFNSTYHSPTCCLHLKYFVIYWSTCTSKWLKCNTTIKISVYFCERKNSTSKHKLLTQIKFKTNRICVSNIYPVNICNNWVLILVSS